MSALTDKIARDHTPSPLGSRCKCSAFIANQALWYAEHIAEVTEDAAREKVAADITELEHTKDQVRAHVANGGSVHECNGFDNGIHQAAQVAKGE